MASIYFADSFYWIALTHRKDASHVRAMTWLQANRGAQIITTEEVLAEVLTWFASKGAVARGAAVAFVRTCFTDPSLRVLPQTSADFHVALAFYESRLDKEYSLIDCRSMVAMKSLGLADVLTNDHHFTQEGFTALFP